MHYSMPQDLIDDVIFRKHRRLGSSPSSPCPELTAEETSERIVDILGRYRLELAGTPSSEWKGRGLVLGQVLKNVEANAPIELVLPGFPFKSPNKIAKVVGVLPDKAEEVALKHLDGLCATVATVYSPGASLYIVSDGPMYNDLLGVDDEEVWQYGHSLRELAMKTNCNNIKFVQFAELLGAHGRESWLRDSFVANVPGHRQSLIEKFTPADFDISKYIKKDKETEMRYRGCIKFLEKDLEHASWLSEMTKSQKKKRHGVTAKTMLLRGECFAAAVAAKFGNHIRLSVHASGSEAVKMSISLLPRVGAHETTPWHNVLIRELDGSMSMAHRESVSDPGYVTADEQGRPSYFRTDSKLFDWPDMEVVFDYLYPCGIVISPAVTSPTSALKLVHMQKVLALAEHCSPVVLRGFTTGVSDRAWNRRASIIDKENQKPIDLMHETKKRLGAELNPGNCVSRSKSMHEIRGANSIRTNNGLHEIYGNDKIQLKTLKRTADKTYDDTQGRFQLFDGPMQESHGNIQLLFASSRLFFQLLPSQYTEEELANLTWVCRKPGSAEQYAEGVPLVSKHPADGTPCIRLPESVPVGITKLGSGSVDGRDDDCSRKYTGLVDRLVNDSRVLTKLELQTGDVVVSDKFSAPHVGTTLKDSVMDPRPCVHVSLLGRRTLWHGDN